MRKNRSLEWKENGNNAEVRQSSYNQKKWYKSEDKRGVTEMALDEALSPLGDALTYIVTIPCIASLP